MSPEPRDEGDFLAGFRAQVGLRLTEDGEFLDAAEIPPTARAAGRKSGLEALSYPCGKCRKSCPNSLASARVPSTP